MSLKFGGSLKPQKIKQIFDAAKKMFLQTVWSWLIFLVFDYIKHANMGWETEDMLAKMAKIIEKMTEAYHVLLELNNNLVSQLGEIESKQEEGNEILARIESCLVASAEAQK